MVGRRMIWTMLKPAALGWLVTVATGGVGLAATTSTAPSNNGGFYAAPAQEGVYVSDSSAALDKLNLADRLAQRGQWDSAGSLLQEILQKFSDKVAPIQFDAKGRATSYIGMARLVHRHLAKWPEEGRRDYANRYEPVAHRLLQQAGRDSKKLLEVVRQYLETPSGRAAALRLMDLRIEEGQFNAAIWLAQSLLDSPELAADRPGVLYRMGWAAHMAAHAEVTQQSLMRLQQAYPGATGVIGGQKVDLAAALAHVLGVQPSIHDIEQGDWPTFAGAADRARIARGVWHIGRKLYSLALPPMKTSESQSLPAESRIGIMPVVDGGLFFQDGLHVFAADLNGGGPAGDSLSAAGGEGDFIPQFNLDVRDLLVTTGPFTMTAGPSSLYAVMGAGLQSPRTFGQNASQIGTTRLVCLDRRTTKVKWMISAHDLSGGPAIKSLEFSGCPILVGEDLYVLGRGNTGNFQSCYVIRLDAASGRLKWVRYVSGASTAANMFGFPSVTQPPVSHPAYAQGRVFIDGEDGTIAAMDADDGALCWLNLYPRRTGASRGQEDNDSEGGDLTARLMRPWASNPVIVRNGKVFVLPADGTDILVYDAGSGRELKRIPRQAAQFADTLIGVWGDWIILTGQSRAWAIDWRQYTPADGKRTIISSADLSPVRGRGLLTENSLYVPTMRQLKRINLGRDLAETGLMVVENYPAHDQTWPKGEGPGNVIAAEDRLIVAGSDSVSVYADWPRLQAHMLDRIKALPHDIGLRLSYARLLLNVDQLKESLAQLDQVLPLVSTSADRSALFDAAMGMAMRRMHAADVSGAAALFQRASSAVSTASQQVQLLLARAVLAHNQNQPEDEIRLLQQILADADLRSVHVSAELNAWIPAAESARRRIARLLKTPAGQTAYAAVEKRAAGQFDLAQARQDPKGLLAVADEYPNSLSASRALMAAAHAYEGSGNLLLAREALKRLLFAAGDFAQPPPTSDALEMLGRLDLRLNHPLSAAARFDAAARIDPTGRISTPLTFSDGQAVRSVGYARAAAEIRHHAPVVVEPAPTFLSGARSNASFSVTEDREASVSDVQSLVPCLSGFERSDRLLCWSNNRGLILIQPGQAKPLAAIPVPDSPRCCAWIGSNLAVLVNDDIICLDGTRGEVLWKWSLAQLPSLPAAPIAVEDAEAVPVPQPRAVVVRRGVQMNGRGMQAGLVQFRAGVAAVPNPPTMVGLTPAHEEGTEGIMRFRPVGSNIIVGTSNGRLVALDAQTGRQMWVRLVSSHPIARLIGNDDFVVARALDGSNQSIIALNAFDGRELLRRTFPRESDTSPIGLALGPQGILVYTTMTGIVGRDLYDPDGSDLYAPRQPTDEEQGRVGPRGVADGGAYAGMYYADKLLIAGDKILAVSDAGRYIRVLSIVDGRLLVRTDKQNRRVPALLATGDRRWGVSLAVSAGRLYAMGAQTIACYGLENNTRQWQWRSSDKAILRRMFPGRDLLGVLCREEDQPVMRLLFFSREVLSSGEESGLLELSASLVIPAQARIPLAEDWAAVDGGMYCVYGDTAHFFKIR